MKEVTDSNAKAHAKAHAKVRAGWSLLLLAGLVLLATSCAAQKPAGQATTGLEHPSLGSEDAPVVMVEYADFQCPFCGEFARDVRPGLVERYVESGVLRIEWRDFPYLGQESGNAALAARAAQDQGRFWEYHDLLFEHQGVSNSGAFSDDALAGFAEELGLDAGRLTQSFTSSEHSGAVAQDLAEGQREGISGTPTFVINGDRTLVGAQPTETFDAAIEEAAREAEDA